jgi:hypothetical protein
MSQIDIARALKDKDYFNSLTQEQQEEVRQAGGIGASEVTDESLESVSGGLEGAGAALATSTDGACGARASRIICVC